MGDLRQSYSHEPEVLAAYDTPTLAERWALLPRRRRHTLAGGTLLALVIAAGAVYAVSQRPEPQPPPPEPYPAQITAFTFHKVTPAPGDEQGFLIALSATTSSTSPVTVDRVGHDYAAIRLGLDPPLPAVVTSDKTRLLTVRAHVTSCTELPVDASMPAIDVTLRNAHAEQKLRVILGERYATALARQLRTLCGLTPAQ